jgi:hypothetical protein
MKFYGIHYGIVKGIEDPENLGRILVRVPEVYGPYSGPRPALPKNSFSGKNFGTQCLPQIGEFVLVSFRNGDARTPHWEHGHWARGDKPKDFEASDTYGFISPKQVKVLVRDEAGEVEVSLPTGEFFKLNKDTITLQKGGVSKIEMTDKSIKVWDEVSVKGETLIGVLDEFLGLLSQEGTLVPGVVTPTSVFGLPAATLTPLLKSYQSRIKNCLSKST